MAEAEKMEELLSLARAIKEQQREFLKSIENTETEKIVYRTVIGSDQVSIRTSNCGRGWSITTRGRSPNVPNFRKIVVNRPDFELKPGVVYVLDSEEKNIVSELPSVVRQETKQTKLSKFANEEEKSRRAEIEAEEVLKSLGF